MSREIKCTVCRKVMGEIRDASLRKGIKYICEPCDQRRMDSLVELHKLKTKPKGLFDDLFDRDIFKGM